MDGVGSMATTARGMKGTILLNELARKTSCRSRQSARNDSDVEVSLSL